MHYIMSYSDKGKNYQHTTVEKLPAYLQNKKTVSRLYSGLISERLNIKKMLISI